MKIAGKLLFFALALAAAGAAQAAPRGYYYPPPSYYAPPQNALRLQIGGAGLSTPTGYLCDPYYCSTVSDSWSALALGGEVDLALGRRGIVYFTLGAHELFAEHASGYPNIFEPWAGLTFKFLRGAEVQPRLSVGLGLLFAEGGHSGASLRAGGGVTLFANAPVGLAVDLVIDGGRVGDADLTQVQFLIGPELHF